MKRLASNDGEISPDNVGLSLENLLLIGLQSKELLGGFPGDCDCSVLVFPSKALILILYWTGVNILFGIFEMC